MIPIAQSTMSSSYILFRIPRDSATSSVNKTILHILKTGIVTCLLSRCYPLPLLPADVHDERLLARQELDFVLLDTAHAVSSRVLEE